MSDATDARATGKLIAVAAGGALLALILILLFPPGFGGGGIDDQRYYDAALKWIADPPYIGRTHWELRTPLVVPLAGLLDALGQRIPVALLLPIPVAVGFAFVNVFFIARATDRRVATLWALLFLTCPLWIRISSGLMPDSIELLFQTAAIWLFLFGRHSRRFRLLFVASGVSAALAIMTRETSAWIIIFYLYKLALRDRTRWIDYAWIAAPAVILLGAEWAWLFSATGDPLYRLHVDMNHVHIPSSNMMGGSFDKDGAVLLNPGLAERWKPTGLFDIHWTINPLLDFLADRNYGLAPLLLIVLAVLRPRTRMAGKAPGGQWPILGDFVIAAIISFCLITYVLVLSQDQRYYSFVLYCLILVAAILLARLFRSGRTKLASLFVVGAVISNIGLTTLSSRVDALPLAAMRMIHRHPGETIYAASFVHGEIATRLQEEGLQDRVKVGSPTKGAMVLTVTMSSADCGMPEIPQGTVLIECEYSGQPFALKVLRGVLPGVRLPGAITRHGNATSVSRVE